MPKDSQNDVTKEENKEFIAPKKQHVRIRKGKHGYYWIIFNGGGAVAVSLKRYTTKHGAKQGFKSAWQHVHMEIIDDC